MHMNSLQSTMWSGALVYISHYWLMSLIKYTCCTTDVCPAACLLYSIYRPDITAHTSKHINNKINLNLPCYFYICASNKYTPKILHICQMPKFFNVHRWGKCANINTMNEFLGINDMMSNVVPWRWWYQDWQWWCNSNTLAELANGQFSYKLWCVWQSTDTHTEMDNNFKFYRLQFGKAKSANNPNQSFQDQKTLL